MLVGPNMSSPSCFLSKYFDQFRSLFCEATCRNFLWTGGTEMSTKALLAQDRVYYPIKVGDLNIFAQNKEAIAKLLWNICTKKISYAMIGKKELIERSAKTDRQSRLLKRSFKQQNTSLKQRIL